MSVVLNSKTIPKIFKIMQHPIVKEPLQCYFMLHQPLLLTRKKNIRSFPFAKKKKGNTFKTPKIGGN